MFYNQSPFTGMGAGSFGGMGGNPTAFSNAGISPEMAARILQMSNAGMNAAPAGTGGMNMGPQIPQANPMVGIGGAANAAMANLIPRVGQAGGPAGAMGQPQQGGLMGGLNPQMLAMLQALGQGGQGGQGGGLGGLLGNLFGNNPQFTIPGSNTPLNNSMFANQGPWQMGR